jgi:hypothetical protein
MKSDLTYWSILQNTLESVKHSETKAGLMITAYGVLSTVLYINATSIFAMISQNPWLIALGCISFFSGLGSFFFAVRCINPRFVKSGGDSIIFFGIVGSKYPTAQAYYEDSKAIVGDKEQFNAQIAEQIYINSKIAIKKFSDVGKSIRFFVINVFTIFLALLLELLIWS